MEEAKQRKVVLMIGEKLEIIKSINAGSSYIVIAEKHGTCIAQLTVANIKKDASKHLKVNENGFPKGKIENNEDRWI